MLIDAAWAGKQVVVSNLLDAKADVNSGSGQMTALSVAIIQTKPYFFGFGIIHVILTAYPENIPGIIQHYNGIKFGPFVIIPKGG